MDNITQFKLPFNGLTVGSVILYKTEPQPVMALILGITHNPFHQQTDYRLYLLQGEHKGEILLCKLEKIDPIPLTEEILIDIGFQKEPIEGYDKNYSYTHPNGMELLQELDNKGFLFVFHKRQVTILHLHTFQLFFNMFHLYAANPHED